MLKVVIKDRCVLKKWLYIYLSIYIIGHHHVKSSFGANNILWPILSNDYYSEQTIEDKLKIREKDNQWQELFSKDKFEFISKDNRWVCSCCRLGNQLSSYAAIRYFQLKHNLVWLQFKALLFKSYSNFTYSNFEIEQWIYTGCFFHWSPPKKWRYGKPRLGESMLT